MEKQVEELQQTKRKLLEMRKPCPERTSLLGKYRELVQRSAELDKRLQHLKDNDPGKVQEYEELERICKISANRWTDNIYELVRFYRTLSSSFNQEEFFATFGLPADLEEVQ
uniref:Leucine zipper with capping helix domain-containing protein n=1 Tax=Lygus hesperus TaxID=30085 RepID=A0A0A9WD62_LYGHE